MADILRKAMRDGAANPWLARRWPGYPRRVGVLRQIVRAGGGVPVWLLRGKPRAAAFKAFDLVWVAAADLGGLRGNGTRRPVAAGRATTLVVGEAPVQEDALLRGLPATVRIEAERRPLVVQDWRAVRDRELWLTEDEGFVERVRALLALAARRPVAVLRGLAADRSRTLRLAPAALRIRRAGGPLAAAPGCGETADRLSALAGAGRVEVPQP